MRSRIPLLLAIVTALIFTNFTEIFAQEVVGSATQTAQKPRRTQEQLDSLRLLSAEKTASIYSGIILDSATREPIQSAVVYLMGTANTLRD